MRIFVVGHVLVMSIHKDLTPNTLPMANSNQILTHFENCCFNGALSREFAINRSVQIAPCIKLVATLSLTLQCSIAMSWKSDGFE